MDEKKKSPLQQKPLRHAGQSLDEEIDKLLTDKVLLYIIIPFIFSFAAFIQWQSFLSEKKINPALMTGVALISIVICTLKLIKAKKKLNNLRLGRDGERVVGEILDNLRAKGCRVFHDLVGERGNVDHLIISQKGIFVVETKTVSKPKKKNAKILYDGHMLSINGYKTDDPLNQVSCQSTWIKETLSESTGKNFQVRSVILYPGWYVKMNNNAMKSNTWALKPENLLRFIEKLPNVIPRNEMMMAAFHISRFIRSSH